VGDVEDDLPAFVRAIGVVESLLGVRRRLTTSSL